MKLTMKDDKPLLVIQPHDVDWYASDLMEQADMNGAMLFNPQTNKTVYNIGFERDGGEDGGMYSASEFRREFERYCERYRKIDWLAVASSNADALKSLSDASHALNQHFWRDLVTDAPLTRNKGELIALMHSELSEVLEGVRKNLQDEKLPHRKAEEVELVDLLIRVFDYAGAFKLDLAGALKEKMQYNKTRKDHTREHRLSENGKKF